MHLNATTNGLPPAAEMERAYLGRDPAYEGIFIVAVRTTGVFCRPTCRVRSPLPKNVEYYPSPREALAAGYRPCKRCRPMASADQPAWAAELMARIDSDPLQRIRERDLRERGVDPATVRRHFQREYGMTFQAYARFRRLSAAFSGIREGESIDDAVFESGYLSHSGFRDAFARTFGRAPGKVQGCDADWVRMAWIQSPLGPLVTGACEQGICFLEFTDRRMMEAQFRTLAQRFRMPIAPGDHVHIERLKHELDEYFAGRRRQFDVPLSTPGTPFQQRVWEELRRIPFGQTCSYQELAERIGMPSAVRAVGHANGLNRVAILVPCHRVIGKDGGLGGYGGGLRRKEFLLRLERGQVGASGPTRNDASSSRIG